MQFKMMNFDQSKCMVVYVLAMMIYNKDIQNVFAEQQTKYDFTNQTNWDILKMLRSVGQKYRINQWVIHTDQAHDADWRKSWHFTMKYNLFNGYVTLNNFSHTNASKLSQASDNATIQVYLASTLQPLKSITPNNVCMNCNSKYGVTARDRNKAFSLYLIRVPDNSDCSSIIKLLREFGITYRSNMLYFTKMEENEIAIYNPHKITGKYITGVDRTGLWNPERGLQMQDPDSWFGHVSLEGTQLRVVSARHPPFVTYIEDNCTTKECSRGIYPDILHDLSSKMNFTYTIERVYKWGSLVNNTWSGMVGLIHDGMKDIAVADITISMERSDAVEFLPILNEVDEEMFLRNPIDSMSLSSYVQPFTKLSWIGVALFIILVPPILAGMVLYGNEKYQRRLQLSDCYLFIAETLLLRTSTVMPTTYSNRISFSFVLFGSFMIYMYWEAMLISFLAVKKTYLPFQNLKELADSSSYQLKVGRGLVHLDRFRYSNDPSHENIWKRQIEPHTNDLPLYKDLVPTILDNPSYLMYADGLGVRQNQAYLDCKIVNILGPLHKSQLAWIVPKNSPYLEIFRYHLQQLKENGIVERYYKMYVVGDQVCPDLSGKPLSLKQCISAFLVFAPGIIFSITWFLLETFSPPKWTNRILSFGNRVFEKLAVKTTAYNVTDVDDGLWQSESPNSRYTQPEDHIDSHRNIYLRKIKEIGISLRFHQSRGKEMQRRIDELTLENISLIKLYRKGT